MLEVGSNHHLNDHDREQMADVSVQEEWQDVAMYLEVVSHFVGVLLRISVSPISLRCAYLLAHHLEGVWIDRHERGVVDSPQGQTSDKDNDLNHADPEESR